MSEVTELLPGSEHGHCCWCWCSLHSDLCLARAPHCGFKLSFILSLQPPIARKKQRNHFEYHPHQKTVIQISSSIFILCWWRCQAPNLGNRSWNEQCLHSFAMLCQYWITEPYRLHAGSDIQMSSFGIFITSFYMTIRKALPMMNCELLNPAFFLETPGKHPPLQEICKFHHTI